MRRGPHLGELGFIRARIAALAEPGQVFVVSPRVTDLVAGLGSSSQIATSTSSTACPPGARCLLALKIAQRSEPLPWPPRPEEGAPFRQDRAASTDASTPARGAPLWHFRAIRSRSDSAGIAHKDGPTVRQGT